MTNFPRRRTVCRVTKFLRSKDCRQHRRAQRTIISTSRPPEIPKSYPHRSAQISEPSPPTSRQARIRTASNSKPLTQSMGTPPTSHETPLSEGPSESRGSRPTTKGAFCHHERIRTNASTKGARQHYRKTQGKQQTGGINRFKGWPVSRLPLRP